MVGLDVYHFVRQWSLESSREALCEFSNAKIAFENLSLTNATHASPNVIVWRAQPSERPYDG
jgi:hypothetical protein